MVFSLKKHLIIFFIFFTGICSAYAFENTSRLKAMGDIGIAVSSADLDFFYNPAMLGFKESSFNMLVKGEFGDSFLLNGKNITMPKPYGNASVIFTGKRISANISDSFFLLDEIIEDDTRFYNAIQDISLGINYAVKISNFSFGAGITGNMSLIRPNIRISNSNRFVDLWINGVFESYKFNEDSENLNIKLGMGFSMYNFSIGLIIPDFYNYRTNDTSFKPREILSSISFGLYYSVPEYNARGKLRNFTGSLGLDLINVGDYNKLGIKAGGEFKLQFTSDYKLSILAGLNTIFKNSQKSVISLGLGAKLNKVNLNLNFYLDALSNLKYSFSGSYTI